MIDKVSKRGKTVEKWEEIHKEESTAAQRGAMRRTEAQAGGLETTCRSFKLQGWTGAIQCQCQCGHFLELSCIRCHWESTDSPYRDPAVCLIHTFAKDKFVLPSRQASSGSVHMGPQGTQTWKQDDLHPLFCLISTGTVSFTSCTNCIFL